MPTNVRIYAFVSPRVPDGEYMCIVESLSFFLSFQFSPHFRWILMITQGPYAGEKMEKTSWLTSRKAIKIALKDFEKISYPRSRLMLPAEICDNITGCMASVSVTTHGGHRDVLILKNPEAGLVGHDQDYQFEGKDPFRKRGKKSN